MCSVTWCNKEAKVKGLCKSHYYRSKKGIDMDKPWPSKKSVCVIDGCSNLVRARGLCRRHYGEEIGEFKVGGKIKGKYRKTKRLNHAGYVVWYNPESENAMSGGWVYEHREILAQKLGRPMDRSETVHHKNGDRSDNRPENLELWSRSQPPGQRIRDKIVWAKEILAKYGNDESKY